MTFFKTCFCMKNLRLAIFFLSYSLIAINAIAIKQSDSATYYTSFDSTKIYYEVKGTGYPVILVHGFIMTGEGWKKTEVYKALQNKGYQVITLDMRGNGRSGKPHTSEAYSNDHEAKDIMRLATYLGLPKYSAVGYSRGSIITARLLVLDKRVNKAVMGGMGTDFTNPEWPRRKMFYRALMGDSVKELEGMVKNIQKAGLDQQALAYLQKEQPSTPKETLAKVKQRVLVICGDKDSDNGNARDLAALFQKGQYAEVPGDHGAAIGTKEFADKVVNFLK